MAEDEKEGGAARTGAAGEGAEHLAEIAKALAEIAAELREVNTSLRAIARSQAQRATQRRTPSEP